MILNLVDHVLHYDDLLLHVPLHGLLTLRQLALERVTYVDLGHLDLLFHDLARLLLYHLLRLPQ